MIPNFDRGLTAFIVGDPTMRLTPDATSNEWATNVKLVEDNDDGLTSRDEYLGVFYPQDLQVTTQETMW